AFPAMNAVLANARLNQAMQEGRAIYVAVVNYAAENDGQYPESLAELAAEDAMVAEILEKTGEFDYFSDMSPASDARLMILASPQTHREKRAVVYADGLAEIINEAEYQEHVRMRSSGE
ncbi:MAG: hypothetical protein AAGA58_04820, partial [Verrucomicrobiota bacterium]